MGLSDKILQKSLKKFSQRWVDDVVGESTTVMEKTAARKIASTNNPYMHPEEVKRDILTDAYDLVRDTKVAQSILGPSKMSGIPIHQRAVQSAKGNITVFNEDYYKALDKIKKGDLEVEKIDSFGFQQNMKIVLNAIKDTGTQKTSAKLRQVSARTGIEYATLREVATLNSIRNKHLLELQKVENAHKLLLPSKGNAKADAKLTELFKKHKQLKRDISRIQKEMDGQIKGNVMASMSTKKRDPSVGGVTPNMYFWKHNLTKKFGGADIVEDIVVQQQIKNIRGKTPVLVKPKKNNFNNDMNRANNLQLVNWTIAHGRKNNMSLQEIADIINKEIKEATFKEFRKNPKFKHMSDSQINAIVRHTNPPRANIRQTSEGEILKISQPIMSGDFTVGSAATITYVKPNFGAGRVLHDVYDGGAQGNLSIANLLKGDVSGEVKKGLGNMWKAGSDKIVTQVSDFAKLDFSSGHLSTLGILRNSDMWKKMSQRSAFKRAVNKVSKEFQISPAAAEDAMLIGLDNSISTKVKQGIGPLRAMEEVLGKYQAKNINQADLLKLVEKELRDMGPEDMSKLLESKGKGVDYLTDRRNRKAMSEVTKTEKPFKPLTKRTKLSKPLEDLVNLASNDYKRGATTQEIMNFLANRGGKATIAVGASKIAYDKFWSDEED